MIGSYSGALTPQDAFRAENDAAMEQMMTAMDVKPSGDIDRDFAAMEDLSYAEVAKALSIPMGAVMSRRALGYSVVGTGATKLLHPVADEVRREVRRDG